MTIRRLLALSHNGVARAESDVDGQWVVEQVLSGQVVETNYDCEQHQVV